MIDLSVITVTHQSAAFIEDQVFSVIAGGIKLSLEQIIVDNASTDGTAEVLERLSHLLAKVIKNGENVGFSAANNLALLHSQGRYVLFLNPDMCVEEGSLDALVAWMDDHPKVGISSCLLVDAIGRKQEVPRGLPGLLDALLWILRLDFLRNEQSGGVEEASVREVENVKGAFMLVRRELIEKLGFAFDPRYFLLYEDTDLCREAKRLGYPVVVHSSVRCVDFNSRSFSTKTGPWIYRCFSKSMLRYFRKWEPWYLWMWIAILIPLGYFLRFPPWKK